MTKAKQKQDALSPFDNPMAWGAPAFSAPLSDSEIARVQKDIDSICGTTRDNKSIAVLVWNGDTRFWKDVCIDWDIEGKPTNFIKRPIVLYRSVYGAHRKFIRDEFPPRWLILTRIEPEQYAAGWERDSKVWCPERQTYIQLKPDVAPKEWHVWFKTIAEHNGTCCKNLGEKGLSCYGKYAHPSSALEELRMIRKGIEASGLPPATPFDSPDRLTRKLREKSVNDYVEQSMRTYDKRASAFIDSVPYRQLRDALAGAKGRELENLEQSLQTRRNK